MHHWLESVWSVTLKTHSDSSVMKNFLIDRKHTNLHMYSELGYGFTKA